MTGPNGAKPEDVKICVLYDPKDGRIVHHHVVATFPGAHAVDQHEVEKRAHARAARLGTNTSNAKALHVSPKEIDPSNRYKVDLESLTLIEIPRPKR